METLVVVPRNCGMSLWDRQNWIMIAWYTWVAALVCGLAYIVFR